MLLKYYIFELHIQLEELEKKLKSLEELQIKRNKIQNALEIAKEYLPSTISINTKEERIEQDMVYNIEHYKKFAYKKHVYNYLLDMKIACSSKNISEYIIHNFKPIKEKFKIQQYVAKSLKRLVDENKIIRIEPKSNFYQIKV